MFRDVVAEAARADDAVLVARLRELEQRRRRDAAEEAALLAELDERKAYAADGHASMWGMLRALLGWSDAECRSRMRIARLTAEHPDAGDALLDELAPVASIAEIGRGFANPRCGTEIESVIGTLLNEACRAEFDDLRIVVRRWEQYADRDGAHRDRASGHEARNAHVVVVAGVGYAQGRWGEIDGLANAEVFARYLDAEWRTDWDQTVETYGEQACTRLMPRTDAQRRADAMTRIFADAASREPGAIEPEPLVNIHLDHTTFEELMVEAELFPERMLDPLERYRPAITDRRCETGHGDAVEPRAALQLALEGHVRFVIHDETGVPIRWGRQRRLFPKAARNAVLSQSWRCTHPGCRVRARRSHADHTHDFARGGLTDPANGNPRCLRHNLIKNRGFTVRRDDAGHWHTYRPDGTEIR